MARKSLQVSEAPENAAGLRPRNVLIYIRVSTEKQSNNQLSLDSQEEHLLARCKRDGDNIAGIFREEGETATNIRRPAFEQMIARDRRYAHYRCDHGVLVFAGLPQSGRARAHRSNAAQAQG